jgi:kanamycin kinase
MVAGPPRSFPVPPVVVQLAGEQPYRAVWENELGGLTFEIGQAAQRRFLKWAPRTAVGLDLEAYGVDPDPERTAYYRLLWELGP